MVLIINLIWPNVHCRALRIDTSDARRRRVTPNYHRRSSISHAHSKLQTISVLDCSENSANLAESFPQSRHNSRKQTHFKSGRPKLMHRHATLSLMTLLSFFLSQTKWGQILLLIVFTISYLKHVCARCAIITRGLYILNPHMEGKDISFKGLFS